MHPITPSQPKAILQLVAAYILLVQLTIFALLGALILLATLIKGVTTGKVITLIFISFLTWISFHFYKKFRVKYDISVRAKQIQKIGAPSNEAFKIAEEEIRTKSVGNYDMAYWKQYSADHKSEIDAYQQELIRNLREKYHFRDPALLLSNFLGESIHIALSPSFAEKKSPQMLAKEIHDAIINSNMPVSKDLFTPTYQRMIYSPRSKYNLFIFGHRDPKPARILSACLFYFVLALCIYPLPQLVPFLDDTTFVPSERWRETSQPAVWTLTILTLYWMIFKNDVLKQRLKNQPQKWKFYFMLPFFPFLIWGALSLAITLGLGKAMNNITGVPSTLIAEVTETNHSGNEHKDCVKLTDKKASFFQDEICLRHDDFIKISPLIHDRETTIVTTTVQSDFGYTIEGYFSPSIGTK